METFLIRTFGCQMNKHDSERVAGMLIACGMRAVSDPEFADAIVFLTCCVRENADERLRGQVASLKVLKPGRHTGPVIAVGGCIGQRDGESLLDTLPHVDVVFGTHNIDRLPSLIEAAATSRAPQIEVLESSEGFASDLPSSREHPWSAWIPVTVGCDNFCTYCVVPYVRGREKSRTLQSILKETSALVADGVVEVTFLGQNVNSYGRDLYGSPRFADVLRAAGETGIERIRFATSHPKDLTDDIIAAMAQVPAVMPYLHLPVQSGSNRILAAMNRVYTREHYIDLIHRVRTAVPGLALSTDVIVGFPSETDNDFEETLALVEAVGFDQAFTFIYSPRAGTPAAMLEDVVPRNVSQARLDRLVAAVQRSALAHNRLLVNEIVPVLFEGPSKRDALVLTGRTPGNRVVHAPAAEGRDPAAYAGRTLRVRIDEAQTWFVSGNIVDP